MYSQTRQIDSLAETVAAVKSFLLTEVQPQANSIDQHEHALKLALDGFYASGVMQVMQRSDQCALNWQREIRELSAFSSGALAFLMTQHLSAIRVAKWGQPQASGSDLIERLVSGDEKYGIGFSQLRRGDGLGLNVSPSSSGFRLDGVVPWATGSGIFSHLIVAAVSSPDQVSFFEVPFKQQSGLKVSQPFKLLAFDVLNTVGLEFEGYEVPASSFVVSLPRTSLDHLDRKNLGYLAWYSLGCARASIEVLSSAVGGLDPHIFDAVSNLAAKVDSLRGQLLAAEDPDDAIQFRAQAHGVANQAAQAAFVASGGRGALITHAAQRLCRESLLWTVLGQSREVRQATLVHLLTP